MAHLSHEHKNMMYRHMLCTHERMSKNVQISKRVTSIVENSVLSDTFATHQPELATIPVEYIAEDEVRMRTAQQVIQNDQFSTHVVPDGSKIYIKEYHTHKNTSVLEFQLLKRNHNVPFIPEPTRALVQLGVLQGQACIGVQPGLQA